MSSAPPACPSALLGNPHYVPRGAPLDDMEMFDAGFFGLSPHEAAIMDPQHRHFLECVWEALEHAGHAPVAVHGPIGVFGGSGHNAYLGYNLLTRPELVDSVGFFLLRHTGNDKDFLTTRVSYALNLHGPSVAVQTACSTSLVAVHLGVQSLLAGECDLAVAGGVTIELPHRQGYLYAEGEILSPDGRCRAFDARAAGTVFGSGAGALVLRRLARRDRRRRHDLCGREGYGGQQRRLGEGELPGAEREGPGECDQRGARGGRRGCLDHHDGRGARHRDAGWRPDRGRGAHRGVPAAHRQAGLLRHRLGEDQHRAHRHRGRRREHDQGDPGAAAPAAPAFPALLDAEPGVPVRRDAVLRERDAQGLGCAGTASRRGELAGRGRHQRARRAARSQPAPVAGPCALPAPPVAPDFGTHARRHWSARPTGSPRR